MNSNGLLQMEIDDFLVKKTNVRFGDWQQTINNDAVAKALTGNCSFSYLLPR
jgi:hypothetical protein